MANWVFCNRCFQPPHRTSCFSLTNCGHVYCDACLGKGKKNECLICKAPCRTVLLSKHRPFPVSDSESPTARLYSCVRRAPWIPHSGTRVRLRRRTLWTRLLCTRVDFLHSLHALP
ncbi:RNF212 isoform 3 [Pan troglodytes]|uniref:RNF212 isoform 3 n=1 Tax=Pan troglodytes TaxID=9598 RepID=A0A2J8K6V1_PANTR|nr:RNF212 isoform 3 [Pan troglodytes]